MRNEVIWNLRDAEGLDIYEYAFLTIVETRGTYYASRERAWLEMRMSRATFYRVRTRLIERGLLVAVERDGSTTTYRVDAEAVSQLPKASLPEHSPSLTEHGGVI